MPEGFSYVIVGAGSAGAALAARLSEDPNASVLLIEAGPPDRHPLQLMPLAFLKLYAKDSMTWHFQSEPEPGLGNRQLDIRRGRTLGGSSSVNAMIAIRGNRRDYDQLSEDGLEGWGYADVLPYFRRLENSWRGDSVYHGTGGPVDISPITGTDMLYEPLRDAAIIAGVPLCDDPNGASQDGISVMEATTGDGKRSSTARAYLSPASQRPNLHIETGATVKRVVLDHSRAVAVEYYKDGCLQVAHADHEIILSAGAINSPQVLMLSGIGPCAQLQAHGIPVLIDLPGVGSNLSDHPNLLNIYKISSKVGLTRHLRYDRALRATTRWFASHRGPFASTGATANVFVRTDDASDRPDAQLIAMPVSNIADLWMPGITPRPDYCVSVRIGPLHPRSRGWVRLRSSNPSAKPRIFFNMFSESSDLQTMISALRISRHIYNQSPLKTMIVDELLPGATHDTDAELESVIRATASHRAHPVGTCRMGLDSEAVVDSQLRVRGITQLRIADASVLPRLPSGNTNLPSIMIGEKAADLVRGTRLPRAVFTRTKER